MRVQHLFGADRDKKGPMLIIEVIFNPNGPDTGAYIAHKWHGTGKASRSEINLLKDHYKKAGFDLIWQYMSIANI